MQYKLIIFDLDGTLLDTLGDLTASVNTLLTRYSYPTHSENEISSFVGHGASYLLKKSLPREQQDHSDTFMEEFLTIYKAQQEFTSLYDGIVELLDYLTSQQIQLSLYTNKPNEPMQACLETYLKRWSFVPALGQTESSPTKPDPQGIYSCMEYHRCKASETLYIGDSEVDIVTAQNAGVAVASVSWGFRTEEQLLAAGAPMVLNSPQELLTFLNQQ